MRKHYHLSPLPLETVAAYIGDGVRKLVARSLAGESIDIDEAVRINADFYRQHLFDRTVLYPGVAAGLQTLFNHGHVQALISNKASEACVKILEHFKVADFFANVIGGDSHLPLKPAPDTICETMRKTKSSTGNTWMIGDNHTDLAAARMANVKSAFVTYGIGETGPEKATRTFAGFDALVEYFSG